MPTAIESRLDGIEGVLTGIAVRLDRMDDGQRTLAEMFERLIDALQPKEAEGPTLAEAFMELAGKLDIQSAVMRDMTSAVAKAMHDVPVAVAEAVRMQDRGAKAEKAP